METIKKWWHSQNRAYSRFCQEAVTNGQVVLTNLTCLLIVAACCVAELLNK